MYGGHFKWPKKLDHNFIYGTININTNNYKYLEQCFWFEGFTKLILINEHKTRHGAHVKMLVKEGYIRDKEQFPHTMSRELQGTLYSYI